MLGLLNLYKEVERQFLVNDLQPVYQAPMKLKFKPSSPTTAVHSVDSQIILDCVGVCEH